MSIVILFFVTLTFCETFSHLHQQFAQKSVNDFCQFNVSQNVPGSFHSIDSVLNHACLDPEGYEISLLDSDHVEYLAVNMNQTIFIGGINIKPTIWTFNTLRREIINLQQGNITLENIEFQFSTNQNKSFIIPSHQFILVGSDKVHLPSLTVHQCVFRSHSYKHSDILVHIQVEQANKAVIDNSTFLGAGQKKVQYTSMMDINNISELIITNSRFKDALLNSPKEAVRIYGNNPKLTILIHDCEFINIFTNYQYSNSALSIWSGLEIRTEITGNKFTNCQAAQSNSGAMYIKDFDGNEKYNEIIVSNNTFDSNKGNLTGAFFFVSYSQYSNYSFVNNIFISNRNSNKSGIGQDAYLIFSQTPKDWSLDNIVNIIMYLFKGSISDAKKDSVYTSAYLKGQQYYGSITLPNKSNAEVFNNYVIAAVVVIIFGIAVFLVEIIYFRMKKHKQNIGTAQESQYLLMSSQKQPA